VATRRARTPLISIGVAYAGFFAGGIVIWQVVGPQYEHSDNLWRGLVFVAWAMLALVAIAVSLTSLMLVAKEMRLVFRIATVLLNLPILGVASLIFVVGIWSLQDYSASFAAYDTAVQVCGHLPVIGQEGWGADYIVPNMFDYTRLRYSSHDRFIFSGTAYYCTAADAQAHGLRPLP
jgi:hypothetical protein